MTPMDARLPGPSLSPGVCSDSCLLSRWCHPTISSSVTPFSSYPLSLTSIRVFSNESALYFSISPSSEHSGLISFKIDWFDLFAVQGTLKSLLQHHNLKASFLWSSAFFMVQLLHVYINTEKTIALTLWTFVAKWCLCFLICYLSLS